VFACPADDGNPVVVDLSTSAWSEGAVRVAAAAGGMLPGGVLVDRAGHDVYDPARLYDQPPSAALAPLGTGPGGTAHKGYALAVMVELLAGALAGAGVCADPAPDGVGGNGGLFLALRARHLGRSDAQLRADVRALEAHLSAADPVAAGCAVRLPGRGAARPCPETVPLPQYLVDDLVALAGRRTAFG
jgi:LDH2 family malate/lactate/ureidoglycolate dehydrogenase